MWLSLNNAFLSIVDASNEPGTLLVRARRAGDIEAVFPSAKVTQSPGRDYFYRAGVKREEVAAALAERVMKLDYPNFKSSVADTHLHRAYARVWGVMSDLQEFEPYSRTPRRGFRAHPER